MTSSDLPLRIKTRTGSASSEHLFPHSPPPKQPKPNIPLQIRTHEPCSSTALHSSPSQSSSHTAGAQPSTTTSSHASEYSGPPPHPRLGLGAASRSVALLILAAAKAIVHLEDAGIPSDMDEEYGADDEESSGEDCAFAKSYREGSR
jgi:hypothetical protein